jgi:hypothetical protein
MTGFVQTVERVVADLATRVRDGAADLAQFEHAKIHAAVTAARLTWSPAAFHNFADSLGVVSHTSTGQPLGADARVDMALAALAPAAPVEAAPAPVAAQNDNPTPADPVAAPVAAPEAPIVAGDAGTTTEGAAP